MFYTPFTPFLCLCTFMIMVNVTAGFFLDLEKKTVKITCYFMKKCNWKLWMFSSYFLILQRPQIQALPSMQQMCFWFWSPLQVAEQLCWWAQLQASDVSESVWFVHFTPCVFVGAHAHASVHVCASDREGTRLADIKLSYHYCPFFKKTVKILVNNVV